jgi:hypothetical protein
MASKTFATSIGEASMAKKRRGLRMTSCELIEKAEGLIGRGHAEGAYRDIVAGEKYADRVLDAIDRHLQKHCGRRGR